MPDLDNTQTRTRVKDACTRQAHAHEPVGAMLADNLKASNEAERNRFSARYNTRYAEVTAQEAIPAIARRFFSLAEAGRTHARRTQQYLDDQGNKP